MHCSTIVNRTARRPMPGYFRIILLALLLLSFGQQAAAVEPEATQLDDPIRINGGFVSAVQLPDSPVRVYKGMPYAAPPVEDLRWRPPQPVIPWEGVLQADSFSDACVQELQRSRLPWTEAFMHQGDASEDCLYLNVWTAAEDAGDERPVMVYIHGGGLQEGSSAIATYDGEALAQKGAVLVTINYRLGPIGFLAHPELSEESEHAISGNYGFLDQVAALRWVQDNIGAFGGDPDNVTIIGQSAGARSVAVLMSYPDAQGLFAKAIRHSGAERREPFSSPGTPLEEAEREGLAVQEYFGANSIEELRQIPAERFLEDGVGRMGTVVDGWIVPSETRVTRQVPVMIGATANDGYVGPDDADLTPQAFRAEIDDDYGEHADTFFDLCPEAADSDVSAIKLEAERDKARVSLSMWAAEQTRTARAFTPTFSTARFRGRSIRSLVPSTRATFRTCSTS